MNFRTVHWTHYPYSAVAFFTKIYIFWGGGGFFGIRRAIRGDRWLLIFFFISQTKYAVGTQNYLNEKVSFKHPKGLLNTMDKEIFRIYLSIK